MNKALRYALLSSTAFTLMAGSAYADYQLNILHINDLHSRIESINRFDSTCSPEDDAAGECFGGVARLKTIIDERRQARADENVVLLNAGDNFQGSLFYTTYKGAAEAEFLNLMGFDAMTVGNHEFDDGEEGLAGFLEIVDFPVLSANVVTSDQSAIHDRIEPSVVLEVGGERIGIVGAVANDTDELSSPGDNVTIAEDVETITAAVEALTADGVNKIIALTHVGYPRDLAAIAKIPEVDVVVGGHSNTFLSNEDPDAAGPYPTMVDNRGGYQVPVVQARAYGKYLGELTVVFDDDGIVTEASGDPILIDASVEPDPAVAQRVAELAEPIEEMKTQVIGATAGPIEGSREVCRAGECAMGNLVTDAMLERVADQGIDVAITNGGGLRASIDEGDITMGEVLTVLPFQNTLATFQLKGEHIIAALENGVSQIEEGAGRFPQVSGLKYTFDPAKPAGERIGEVMVDDGSGGFGPIDQEATYGVVSNNFMRAGGDGYSVFAEEAENAYDYGPGLETVVADYLAENQPYQPYTDGRITEASAEMEMVEGTMSEESMAEDSMAGETGPAETTVTTPDLPAGSAEMTTTPPSIAAEEAMSEAAMDGAMADETMAEDTTAESDEAMAEETMSEDTMAEDTATDMASEEEAMGEDAMSDESMGEEAMAMEDAGSRTHTVAAGDTFWDLAVTFYGDGQAWRRIAEANPSSEARNLEIGAELTIPPQP